MNHSFFVSLSRLVEGGESCPMCSASLDVNKLTPTTNWKSIILSVDAQD